MNHKTCTRIFEGISNARNRYMYPYWKDEHAIMTVGELVMAGDFVGACRAFNKLDRALQAYFPKYAVEALFKEGS